MSKVRYYAGIKYEKIAHEARRLGADKVVLYGSRARGDHRERSDIDLAVFGLDGSLYSAFMDMIESLPTLLDFDIVFISEINGPTLLANIEKDGVIIMDKFAEKYEKLDKAVNRLEEALIEYAKAQSDIVRDGTIQRFEFCVELAWKTLREYLIDQGYTEVNSPKAVMKQAYADGLLGSEDEWLSLLNDRNVTSQIYDDATAEQVFDHIRSCYVDLFRKLIEMLKEKSV